MGMQSFASDLGFEVAIDMNIDANATIGTLHRKGLGKMRHIQVAKLWLQDVVKQKRMNIKKVPGKDNPADLMTKYVPEHEITKHMKFLGFEFI